MSEDVLKERMEANAKLVEDIMSKGVGVSPMVALTIQIDMVREQLYDHKWSSELDFNIEFETRVGEQLEDIQRQVNLSQLVVAQ